MYNSGLFMESFLCVIFCNWTSCLKNFFLSSLCVGFKNKLNSFRFVVSPPCSLHFLSNKATNFVSSFGFLYWFGNYFFDNSLCSNVHSVSIESRVLNIFFNDYDESFSFDSLLLRTSWTSDQLITIILWKICLSGVQTRVQDFQIFQGITRRINYL